MKSFLKISEKEPFLFGYGSQKSLYTVGKFDFMKSFGGGLNEHITKIVIAKEKISDFDPSYFVYVISGAIYPCVPFEPLGIPKPSYPLMKVEIPKSIIFRV